jgi:hypothetical protein
MNYWDCPRCAAENVLDATSCRCCGYQYFPGPLGATATCERSRELGDSIQEQSKDTLQKLTRDLTRALDDGKISLERLARKHSGGTGTDDAD